MRAIPTCVGTTARELLTLEARLGHPHVRGDYKPPKAARERPAGHPHVRGDYQAAASTPVRDVGPSPRAWGLLRATSSSHALNPGHPHVRGDYFAKAPVSREPPGHPHVRGDYSGPHPPATP